MSKRLPDITFADILPASISGDESIRAAASAIDDDLKQINQAIDSLYIYSRWDELEEPLLTHLAWQFKVDFWDDSLTLEKKRALVRNSVARHRQKGTPAAIEGAIADVLGGGTVEEWWTYDGQPYHFRVRVEVTDQGVTDQAYAWADQLIEAYKNVRSKLDAVITYLTGQGTIHMAMAGQYAETVSVFPWQPESLEESGPVYFGLGTQMIETTCIYP
ncbi:phage tail protein I [Desulfoluna spongiiphila]|uniref:Phage tail protein, P2 protein I family n=1 Tax=Desulfoluna spongiiphila TaxID=419481 RepID=A0A1G5B4I5_9BACT|nr:phage tail protein I [Desulfoluna spongiiphila]SCX84950.1 phage tail protein, P2 protein I family [Desulfoluna spongiiphila]